jgi:hypothetical protein
MPYPMMQKAHFKPISRYQYRAGGPLRNFFRVLLGRDGELQFYFVQLFRIKVPERA